MNYHCYDFISQQHNYGSSHHDLQLHKNKHFIRRHIFLINSGFLCCVHKRHLRLECKPPVSKPSVWLSYAGRDPLGIHITVKIKVLKHMMFLISHPCSRSIRRWFFTGRLRLISVKLNMRPGHGQCSGDEKWTLVSSQMVDLCKIKSWKCPIYAQNVKYSLAIVYV